MARRRMIDPNFWESEDLARCSLGAKLLFIGLISLADDEGRGRCNTRFLKSRVFTYDDDIDPEKIEALMNELAHNVSVLFYRLQERNYYQLMNWHDWQRIDRPTKSRISPPNGPATEWLYGSETAGLRLFPDAIDEDSPNARRSVLPKRKEEKRKEVKEKKTNTSENASVPVCDQVVVYLNEKAGTAYRKDTETTIGLIEARLEEGYTKQELCTVIDKKCEDWLGTHLQRFLRPQTLFGDNFESYVNQPEKNDTSRRMRKRSDHAHEYDMEEIDTALFDNC